MTGTAANALALCAVTPPHGRVYCHKGAHIATDEVNAPGFWLPGLSFELLPGSGGKIDCAAFAQALERAAWGSINCSQPTVLSITQPTECGTVYRCDEIRQLTDVAHQHGLAVHMDGARLANAIAHVGCSAADMTWRCGVDVLSLGANKNGCLLAEAVVVFGARDIRALWYKSKQGGQLASKMRFVSAQLLAYAKNRRWLETARLANDAAQQLATKLLSIPNVDVLYSVEANIVIARIPSDILIRMRAAGVNCHEFEDKEILRFVTSFQTEPAALDKLFLSL
jgi:threonine aldolase